MKGTFGRLSRGPHAMSRPHTVVLGTIARSVRDVARHYDVTAGPDPRDPWSLPNPGGWEAGLGTADLVGKRVAIIPSIGGVTLEPGVADAVQTQAKELIRAAGMVEVDLTLELPNLAAQWMMGNLSTLLAELGHLWPACAYELTDEVALGLQMAQGFYNLNLAAVAESQRLEANEAMASAFDQADFIICATNPGPAFPAENTMSNPNKSFLDDAKSSKAARAGVPGDHGDRPGRQLVLPKLGNTIIETMVEAGARPGHDGWAHDPVEHLRQTRPCRFPEAWSTVCPVGMQILAPHHRDDVLFDVALTVEREIGWPKVAPGVARATASACRPEARSDRRALELGDSRPAARDRRDSDGQDDLRGLSDLVDRCRRATRISVTADSFQAATRSAMRAGVPTREISSANSSGTSADGLVPPALEEHVLDLLGLLAEAHPRCQLRVVVLALRTHPADVEREHRPRDGQGGLERLRLRRPGSRRRCRSRRPRTRPSRRRAGRRRPPGGTASSRAGASRQRSRPSASRSSAPRLPGRSGCAAASGGRST